MSPRRIAVQRIVCTRSNQSSPASKGFQVVGYKDIGQNLPESQVGFILSEVRVISFRQVERGIRTRIKWISTGFEVREEIHALDRVVDTLKQNNVVFVSYEDHSMVVMQGEPNLAEGRLMGQMVLVTWDWENDSVQIDPPYTSAKFHCTLDAKNKRIDCLVR
ncbi:MAG: hypothetical protein ACFFE8_09900 [Candidatus Heimdallarchaeota archaeon]